MLVIRTWGLSKYRKKIHKGRNVRTKHFGDNRLRFMRSRNWVGYDVGHASLRISYAFRPGAPDEDLVSKSLSRHATLIYLF